MVITNKSNEQNQIRSIVKLRTKKQHKDRFFKHYDYEIKFTLALITIISIAFGYIWQLYEAKKSLSLTYVKRFNEEPFISARKKLITHWISNDGYKELIDGKENIFQIPYLYIKNNKLDSDLIIVYDFFRETSNCVRADQCEPNIICSFFVREMYKYTSIYDEYLKIWEENWKEPVKAEIYSFIDSFCVDQKKTYYDRLTFFSNQ